MEWITNALHGALRRAGLEILRWVAVRGYTVLVFNTQPGHPFMGNIISIVKGQETASAVYRTWTAGLVA